MTVVKDIESLDRLIAEMHLSRAEHQVLAQQLSVIRARAAVLLENYQRLSSEKDATRTEQETPDLVQKNKKSG